MNITIRVVAAVIEREGRLRPRAERPGVCDVHPPMKSSTMRNPAAVKRRIMVLLDGPIHLGRDLDTIVKALYPLHLEIDAPIHATPVSAEVFQAGQWSLHRNAKREGVLL
jgi:hypothetical protein